MNRHNWLAASAAACIAATFLVACSAQKAPAEQAVADLDTTLSAMHDSAAKYSPAALQSVEAQAAGLRQSLASGDYKGVLAAAPAANTAAASLQQDVDAKKAAADTALAQTKQQWHTLSEEVPKMIADVHARVDALAKMRKLPKGITKTSFESSKADAASLDSMWSAAGSTLASEDDYADAVAKAQAVKDKAAALKQALGG